MKLSSTKKDKTFPYFASAQVRREVWHSMDPSGSKYALYDVKDVVKKLEKDKEGTIRQLREKLLAKVDCNIPPVY